MTVANPREVPEYELNPLELQVRKADGIAKAWPVPLNFCTLSDALQFVYCLRCNVCDDIQSTAHKYFFYPPI